ncbi:MAG TPA: YCF48-related protein [Solirubrobacterales bacterium]|nr:YCF48-related protein [Solirubrobacterales bacterium]
MGLRRAAVRCGRWMAAIGVLGALLMLAAAAPAAAAPTWHQQHSGSSFLTAVSFPDTAHGWAVGAAGLVLATSNGGETWVEQQDGASGNNNLNAVSFVDDQHGWAVGRNGTIITTSDGGALWSAQDSGTTESLGGVSFADDQHGWAVGQGGLILATSDGGAHWTQQSSGATTSTLTSVSFANPEDGWVVGVAPPVVLATTDGGALWTPQAASLNATGVDAVDSQHAWIVGTGGEIVATTDGGANWAVQDSGVSVELNAVSFADQQNGWAVGALGTVLVTYDGGATWSPEFITAEHLLGASFPDSTHGILVGNEETIYGYFEPGPAASLEVTASSSTGTAGSPLSFEVTARDSIGHVATGYTGTLHFTSNDPDAVLPADSTLTAGVGNFQATPETAQALQITATDGSLSGTSGVISVAAGPATELELTGFPVGASAGSPFGFHVTALDQFGNVATSYTGTLHFTSTDPSATLPADSTLTAGEGVFPATMRTAGSQTISVGDGVLSATSPTIPVAPGPTTEVAVSAPPTATAGTPFDFEVDSFDAFGNPTPGYTGTLHFTSTDPGATLPADSTLAGGNGQFQATLGSGGVQTISATDVADTSITASSAPIVVGKVTPTLSVLASGGVTLGGAVHARATLNGVDPTGSLEFALYGPGDANCAGAPVHTASVPVSGAGEYDSPSFTPSAAGTYRWVVSYAGDGANLGVATGCADPTAAVSVVAAPTEQQPPAPTPPSQITVFYSPNHAHAPNRAGGPRYTFVFADPAPGVTFSCRLDGKPWKACSSPAVYRNLRRGRHVFRVKSVDATGVASALESVKFSAGSRRR